MLGKGHPDSGAGNLDYFDTLVAMRTFSHIDWEVVPTRQVAGTPED